jgi:Domain of unknown function (DUF4252)
MKVSSSMRRWLLGPVAALAASVALAAPPATLKLPDFEDLAAKATESVNISLDTALLGLAAGFLDSSDPEDAATKELIGGLKGIYVRSYTFGEDFAYPSAQVDLVRKQLAAPAWQRLLEVNSSREHTHVDIYVSVDRGVANGLAIIASQPREFTIVNIVGSIDLAKLHRLEGKFGVPKLALPQGNDAGKDDRQPGK